MIKRKTYLFALIAGLTAFCLNGPVVAQTSSLVIDTEPNYVGVALGIAPDHPGSDDYQFVAGPFGRYTFKGERYVELIATQLSANLIDHPILRLGPAANLRFGRDDVDDPVVDQLTDVDTTLEIGLTGGIEIDNASEPRNRIRFAADFLYDVGDGHDGYVFNMGLRYWRPVSNPIDLGFGIGASYASGDFMSSFFSVTGDDASRSGLQAFNADEGFKDVTAFLALVYHLNPNWHVATGLRYQHYVSAAADSPIVETRGSENQFIAGIGVAYSW